ncbi:MAG: hypothetical protein IJ776_09290 [Paludibacteraceae bacterium]|nr:hypothetical protein [Paludibacteraceae bacterium]
MPTRNSVSAYVAQQRKRRTVKTRDRYNITSEEERALYNDIMPNSGSREWGMSARMIDALIDRHRRGNDAMKRIVLGQVEDMNYHSLARKLDSGDYRGALQENRQRHKEEGTKPTGRYNAQYGLING